MKKNLLTKSDYDKILKMSHDEIGTYLEEFEYKKEVDELAIEYGGMELVERTLQLNLGNNFTKLLQISPIDLRLLIALYLKRYDVYNIKTIMRAKFSNLSPEEAKKQLSPVTVEKEAYFDKLLAQNSVEDIFSTLSFLEEKEIRAALEHFKNNNSLVMIESVIDKHYFTHVFSQLRYLTLEGKLYRKFLLKEIDASNVKLILRAKREGIPDQDIKDMALAFGSFPQEAIEKIIKSDIPGILKELEHTDFKDIAEKHSKSEKINFADFEVDIDYFLVQQSRKLIRQHPMSVDIILGYMFLKDLEVKNLMRIIKAKQLCLSEDFIEKIIVI